MPKNPNNCDTCRHRQMRREIDGWCYMFRDEPTETCMQHTLRRQSDADIIGPVLTILRARRQRSET